VWKNPVLALYPGAAIMLTVLSYNALGDALSDTLDPRHAGL
jgi:ABC-type dipeptide/oligopeptide/nickel transport system permease subunit